MTYAHAVETHIIPSYTSYEEELVRYIYIYMCVCVCVRVREWVYSAMPLERAHCFYLLYSAVIVFPTP